MSYQERAVADASAEFHYDARSFLRRALGREPAAGGAGVFCDNFESGDTSAWGSSGGVCLESLVTEPLYDSAGLLHAVDQTEVLYFAGRPVAQVESVPLFLTTDHLGTPIHASNEIGVEVWEDGLEPFGQQIEGNTVSFLRLFGQWDSLVWSSSSEGDPLFYNLYRWYSAPAAAYRSEDPLGYFRYKSAATVSGSSKENITLNIHPFNFAASRPVLFRDPLGLECESGCEDCPGGFWLGFGGKGDLMIAFGLGVGGNAAVSRMFCTSSSATCDLFTICGKFIGVGGSVGATGFVAGTANTKCFEGLESVTVGVDLDVGKVFYGSAGGQVAPQSLDRSRETGFGGQGEVGVGIGASGGLAVCKAWRISCRKGSP